METELEYKGKHLFVLVGVYKKKLGSQCKKL